MEKRHIWQKTAFLLVLAFLPFSVMSQAMVPDTVINHAWIKGVYWNRWVLPGWGFFVDVQEETMFGAIYGYDGPDSTFVTLQGKVTSAMPLEFSGDVFFLTNGGSTATDVGDFTWQVRDFEASPAATLSISSNVINRSDLQLVRFSYVETDKVDMFTGADWNITRRLLGSTFGDHYGIFDDRYVDGGTTYAVVVDNSDTNKIGVIAYVTEGSAYAYAMLVQFSSTTDAFYVFLASDTDMYGRYWLLDEGESPSGNGNYFQGSADTMQAKHQELGIDFDSEVSGELHELELSHYKQAKSELPPMFSSSKVQFLYEQTRSRFELARTRQLD